MTTETKPTGDQSQVNEANAPWNMDFASLMKSAGKVVDTVVNTVSPSPEVPSTDTAKPVSKKPWEMAFDELKKFIPSRTPEPAKTEAPSPAPEAPKGAYFAPENDNEYQSKVRKYYEKQIKTESGGKHYDKNGEILTSSAGAKGLAQVKPKTGQDPGMGVQPQQNDSPEESLRFGFDYMSALNKKYDGDMRKTLAAYNWGMGKVDRAIAQSRKAGTHWEARLPSETRNYLTKILGK